MLPLIIDGKNYESRSQELSKLFKLEEYTLTKLAKIERSIGIELVHGVIQSFSVSSTKKRLLWIEEANDLTREAQNALLKFLEEPPASTSIVLTLESYHSLLPTVISRCQVIHLSSSSVQTFPHLDVVKKALVSQDGERVSLASSVGRKKEELIAWVIACQHELLAKLRSEQKVSSLKLLAAISLLSDKLYRDLHANVTPGLAMQNFFLELPKVK